MADNPFSFKKRLASFKHAFAGLVHLFRKEHNSWVHAFVMVAVLLAGILFRLSILEWVLVILVIGLVFITEVINTSIERVVDLASPDYHPLAKQAKDLAAAGVLVSAIMAIVIGILIFGPKIIHKLKPDAKVALELYEEKKLP